MTSKVKTPSKKAAKISQAKAAAGQQASQDVELSCIVCLPQVRTEMDPEELQLLAESMRAHGLLQPILVRLSPKAGIPINGDERNGCHPHDYIVIAGHRRVAAAKSLNWTTIPAIVREADDEEANTLQLIENIQREELSLADTAAGVLQLYERHKSLAPVGAILGKSVPWVSKHLSAATKLGYSVRKLLDEGRTEDLDLLLTLNQIEALTGGWATLQELVSDGKMPSRKQAKDALVALRKENEERKANQASGQRDLELTEEELQAREAERVRQKHIEAVQNTYSHLMDTFAETEGLDVDAQIGAIDAATWGQLEKMAQAHHQADWDRGTADRGHVRMLLTTMMTASLYVEDFAAYSLGLQSIPLTMRNLLVEWRYLNIEERSRKREADRDAGEDTEAE